MLQVFASIWGCNEPWWKEKIKYGWEFLFYHPTTLEILLTTDHPRPPVFTTAAAREMKIVWWFSKRELVSLCFWMVSNSVMMPVVLQRCFTRRQAASSGYSTTIIWRAFSALTIFPKSVNEEVDVLLLANVYIQTKKHGWRLGTLGWKWMAFTLVVKSAHGLLLCKVTFGSLKRKRETLHSSKA